MTSQPSVSAIIPAAGVGSRMQAVTSEPKQFTPIQGKPILTHTLLALEDSGLIESCVVVAAADMVDRIRSQVIAPYNIRFVNEVVTGGSTRQQSVWNGLQVVENFGKALVLVHDGVRPLVSIETIARTIDEAAQFGAAVAGIPAVDTIKKASGRRIESTIDRSVLWYAQTPQTFRLPLLVRAFTNAMKSGFTATDEAMLVEYLGEPVRLVEGSKRNIKITDPVDLEIAAALIDLESGE